MCVLWVQTFPCFESHCIRKRHKAAHSGFSRSGCFVISLPEKRIRVRERLEGVNVRWGCEASYLGRGRWGLRIYGCRRRGPPPHAASAPPPRPPEWIFPKGDRKMSGNQRRLGGGSEELGLVAHPCSLSVVEPLSAGAASAP